MKYINQLYPKESSKCNCLNVRRASRAITQFYDDALKVSGVTIAQLGLLQHLDLEKPISISELAKIMRIDRTTLNRNMKPLLASERITMNRGSDSRIRQVTLTKNGKETVAQAWVLWEEAQVSLKEYLGEEDQEKLVGILSKLEALIP